MKYCITSICIFILCTAFIFINSSIVVSNAEDLLNILDEFPDDMVGWGIPYEKLKDKWEKCEKILGYSVSHSECDEVKKQLVQIGAYAEKGDLSGYMAQISGLRVCISDIAESESLSLKGII